MVAGQRRTCDQEIKKNPLAKYIAIENAHPKFCIFFLKMEFL